MLHKPYEFPVQHHEYNALRTCTIYSDPHARKKEKALLVIRTWVKVEWLVVANSSHTVITIKLCRPSPILPLRFLGCYNIFFVWLYYDVLRKNSLSDWRRRTKKYFLSRRTSQSCAHSLTLSQTDCVSIMIMDWLIPWLHVHSTFWPHSLTTSVWVLQLWFHFRSSLQNKIFSWLKATAKIGKLNTIFCIQFNNKNNVSLTSFPFLEGENSKEHKRRREN